VKVGQTVVGKWSRIGSVALALLSLCAGAYGATGTDWSEAISSTSWSGREGHSAFVYNQKMWVVAGYSGRGYDTSDCRYSSDGVTWTDSVSSAPWGVRSWHSSVAQSGKVWVMGGFGPDGRTNDVWYSSDCVKWSSATLSAGWPKRARHSSVAFGGRIWVIGGVRREGLALQDKNDVWYSSNGVKWTSATLSAPWRGRGGHTALVFGGRIWVIGGGRESDTTSPALNDIWYSSDGVRWTSATLSAAWSPRDDHSSVVFNGRIWVIGGSWRNDVWCSSDGVNWTCVTPSAPWSPRSGHTSVVFNNRMWVIGDDVWSSADGVNWTQHTPTVPSWSARDGHHALSYNGRMWVLGGYQYPNGRNDVWSSSDGTSWTLATPYAAWTSRAANGALVYGGKMWILGGSPGAGAYAADVWNSTDGQHWTMATARATWSPRAGPQAVAFAGKMWVLGGLNGSGYQRDVWYSTNGVTWTSATTSAPWVGFTSAQSVVVHDDRLWAIQGHTVWWSLNGATWTQATNNGPWRGTDGIAVAACDGKLWVMGGGYITFQSSKNATFASRKLGVHAECFNDVWYSKDGQVWRQATPAAPWMRRFDPAVLVHNRRLWILGGLNYYYDGWNQYTTPLNDVWYSPIPADAGPSWKLYR